MYFLLMLTILVYSEGEYIFRFLINLPRKKSGMNPDFCIFSGTDIKAGAANDGSKYYDVKSKTGDDKINGCYEKTNFHGVHLQAQGHKYPIYEQISGQNGLTFYLTIDFKMEFAPWILIDEKGDNKYT